MSIVQRSRLGEIVIPNPAASLAAILSYDMEIVHRMMQNYEDSNGEVLDSRMFQAQKLILDCLKTIREFDPKAKEEDLAREKLADLALAVAKKQLKEKDTAARRFVTISP